MTPDQRDLVHRFRRFSEKLAQKQTCCRLGLQQKYCSPPLAGNQFASELSKLVLKGVADGIVDNVVGTHWLPLQDTHFKNRGLLIVDEEHRFGVRHKEQMKALRADGNGVIREAVLRELNRGGQVYFLHNEVETIENRRACGEPR